MSERYSAGVATAYGAALRGGYTGTYNDFCNDVAKLGDITEELGDISATATTLEAGSSATASYNEGVFAFGIPRGNTGAQGERGETGAKGDKGDTGETGATGATGNGIAFIAKTGTSGLVDTYTITFTDGTTTTFDVTNGAEAIDDTLSIAGRAADAKATGNAVNDLKSDFNRLNDGMSLCQPAYILEDVIYQTNGLVKSHTGAICYVYEIDYGKEYSVTIDSETWCGYGLSNKTFSGEQFTTEYIYYNTDSNSNSFTNSNGYRYLYITKNNDTVERSITIERNLADVVLGIRSEGVIDGAAEHLALLADSSIRKQKDYYIKSTTGEVISVAGFIATDFIYVSGYKKLVLFMPILTSISTHAGLAFYGSDNVYISGIDCNVGSSGGNEVRIIDVPSNAVYMRTSCRLATWSDFFVKADDIYINEKRIDALEPVPKPSSYGMQLFEKVGVIGDSISVGWAKDKNGNNSRRNTGISWVQQMARRIGCTAYNLGASGVDPVEWFQPNYEFAQYCYTQYQSVGFCDLYIIGLGLNPTSTLGSISDINLSDYTQNAETFFGQYARIIQMINAEHPDAIVICVTEPTTRIASTDQAVRDICALSFINANLVDLEKDYFDLFNTEEIISERQPDGLHYTPYGYSLLADAMETALNDYIAKNPTHFKYVGVTSI